MYDLVEGKEPKNITGVVSRGENELIYNFDADVIKNIDDLPLPERDKFWGLSSDEKLMVDVFEFPKFRKFRDCFWASIFIYRINIFEFF